MRLAPHTRSFRFVSLTAQLTAEANANPAMGDSHSRILLWRSDIIRILLKTLCTYRRMFAQGKRLSVYKRLQLDWVEGVVVGGFLGAPLTDPVHGEDRDAWIVLSRVLVNSKKDTFQLGLCEVSFKIVRIDEKVFSAVSFDVQIKGHTAAVAQGNRDVRFFFEELFRAHIFERRMIRCFDIPLTGILQIGKSDCFIQRCPDLSEERIRRGYLQHAVYRDKPAP